MWKSKLEFSDRNRICRIMIEKDERSITFAEVIQGWKNDEYFRDFYISLIASMPFEALFWESPAITLSSVNQTYECVCVNSVRLAKVKANSSPFQHYFQAAVAEQTVVSFDNLGKDALLVVPCPQDSADIYPHLAKFLREASSHQCHEFFRVLAKEIDKKLSNKPLWISTSGLGVYWLHVRLDSRPKYYTFLPYKVSGYK